MEGPHAGVFARPGSRLRSPRRSIRAPVHAIILSAGQGRRLLPLTASTPKCLLSVGGRTVLEWEIEALLAAGIRACTVVVGFRASDVAQTLARGCPPAASVRTSFNPLFDSADNLISCWVARRKMEGDFLLLNGDTLFEPRVAELVLSSEPAPVTVAVRHKQSYDADDMKVSCASGAVRKIGKALSAGETDAESIGMLLFRGDGPRLFRDALDVHARLPEAGHQWYLSVIDAMAGHGLVRPCHVDGLEWAEIDDATDLEMAAQMVARWTWPVVPGVARHCA